MKRLVALCLLGLTGCGTVVSMNTYGPRIYSGVRYDSEVLVGIEQEGPGGLPFPLSVLNFLIDGPLSLAFDTVFLPWTIWHTIEHGEYRPKSDPPPLSKVEGVVVEADEPGIDVLWKGKQSASERAALSDVMLRITTTVEGNREELCNSMSGVNGRFTLGGSRKHPWELLRVEGKGLQPFECSVTDLHSPYDKAYWKDYLLRIHVVRR